MDGTALVEIGRETSEQLEFISATARVLVHVRPKYACPKCKTGVRIAPLPPQPIPKSMASPSLLTYVAISKYGDALPLYRQEKILERLGIDLPRATLASWMLKAGELVQPLVERMREEILTSGFVQCDESRFQVLKEPGKAAESLSYVWVQRGGSADHPLVLYEYDPSRSAEVPKRIFEGYEGVLQTDGYEGYGALGREPGVVHLGCWAHARRKFTDALKGYGKKRKKGAKRSAKLSKAEAGLRFIQKLYAIERTLKDATAEERLRGRQERSLPVASELRSWLDDALGAVVAQSLTGKAVAYLDGQWPKLVRIFEYGHVPLDTNAVENAIRPFAPNWERVIPFLALPKDIRKAIYTTNAIESLNSVLRRTVRTRGHFPSDQAATKLLYVVTSRAAKKWTRPIKSRPQALNQFALDFEGRLPV